MTMKMATPKGKLDYQPLTDVFEYDEFEEFEINPFFATVTVDENGSLLDSPDTDRLLNAWEFKARVAQDIPHDTFAEELTEFASALVHNKPGDIVDEASDVLFTMMELIRRQLYSDFTVQDLLVYSVQKLCADKEQRHKLRDAINTQFLS